MFRMKPGEKILDLQKRFTHITNHLTALGKLLSNSDLNLKVIRSLNRTWQPKEKIEKYESSEDEDEKEEIDDMSLFVKKFSKFLRRNKCTKTRQINRLTKNNEASTSNQNITCFECGKPGNMKMDCPNIKKGSFKGKNKMKNGRKACIAPEDNDTSSTPGPKSEEQAHLSLMVFHHSDDEEETLRAAYNLWYLDSGYSKHMTDDIVLYILTSKAPQIIRIHYSAFKQTNRADQTFKQYQSWKPRLIERFSPERKRISWEGEILDYTRGFSPGREMAILGC
ncbi:hypothetical protein Lal_00013750 [Lupinus albus]|nr:hypothetical protein Lal_00013750 [Lupinus albus]